ncbi:MAG: sodium:solute symporter family protein [Saprospiraceae bacterium]|nr:sodium:solute symporter family protein [Saprospiraceae bacterium]
MLLTSIIIYLVITLLIGFWASRKVNNTKDFVVAGRQLPTYMAAAALFATWFGSETIMGASSEFVEHGLIGVIEDPFGAALCLILVGAFYARPLYRMNILTFNDFFKLRFSRAAEVISAVFMVPSYFGWIAAQLVALAIVFQTISGLPLTYGILICAGVVVLYTYIGGMWAVSVTDLIQTVLIIVGLVVLAVTMVSRVGGLNEVIAQAPDDFFRFLPKGNALDITHYVAAWITIGLGSIPQQDVFQRVMASKSADVAVRASYLSGIMYLTIGFIPLLIGLCGSMLYPVLTEGDTQMVIPRLVLQHGSLALQILLFGALVSAILSTTSGAMLAPATVIGENLIRPLLKNPSDQTILRIMRGSVVLVAICSAWMATVQSNIYELVGQSSALSLVSLFVPLTGGLYWKKSSNWGCLSAIILGMVTWIIFEFIIKIEVPSLILGGLASAFGLILGSWLYPDNSYAQFGAHKMD